jgi:hypothetical protein
MRSTLAIAVALLLACLINVQVCYGVASSTRIIVEISGQFSTDPNDIRTTYSPGPFPIPSLLGGSFAGSFEYRLELGKSLAGGTLKEFRLSDTSIAVLDNSGNHVFQVHLPTSGEPANPLKVISGEARFALGPSFYTQSGFVPRMPTDIRFNLLSSAFTGAADLPPSAGMLNSSSVSFNQSDAPFVELDGDGDPFSGWDLPITSISFLAREVAVPEPSTLVLSVGIFALLAARRRHRG